MATAPHQFTSFFTNWMGQQEADLEDLLHALGVNTTNDDHLSALVARTMRRFEDYSVRRCALVRRDPPAFFCPSWNSTFENSFLWLGGCRPTICVRLVYSQSSAQIEANLPQFLAGGTHVDTAGGGGGGMLNLSAAQLNLVNELHLRTTGEEQRLSERFAILQEDVADVPLLPLAQLEREGGGVSNGGANNHTEAMSAMDEYREKLAVMLEEADDLRVRTVREMVEGILTPKQAVEMFAAGKKLHLAVHLWGCNRDREREQT